MEKFARGAGAKYAINDGPFIVGMSIITNSNFPIINIPNYHGPFVVGTSIIINSNFPISNRPHYFEFGYFKFKYSKLS